MTQSDFVAMCNTYCIDPAIALENDDIRAALRAKDNAEVERILRDEY